MRILCRHGHFAFYPDRPSDVARFSNYFDETLKRERDYFTFEALIDAPNYSLTAKPYLNLPALTTYEGEPWDVMRENDFVYNIDIGLLVPKLSILKIVEIPLMGFCFRYGAPLLQPGSRTLLGQTIMSYSAQLDIESPSSIKILEYAYE